MEHYTETPVKKLEIIKTNNGELFIQIIDNFYNIIKKTIHNEELAKKILKLVEDEESF